MLSGEQQHHRGQVDMTVGTTLLLCGLTRSSVNDQEKTENMYSNKKTQLIKKKKINNP